ncbi:hypothetical protein BDR26DRAFT_857778 [Obelidium mucronatum]|nr:hypothetical protein BDR26DRAFT_857778 [Obelidium mucronatum]
MPARPSFSRSRFASPEPSARYVYSNYPPPPPSSSAHSEFEDDNGSTRSALATPSSQAQSLYRPSVSSVSSYRPSNVAVGSRSAIVPPAALSYSRYNGPMSATSPAWDMHQSGSVGGVYRPNSATGGSYSSRSRQEDAFFVGGGGASGQRRNESSLDYASDYDSSASVSGGQRGNRRVEFDDDNHSLRSDHHHRAASMDLNGSGSKHSSVYQQQQYHQKLASKPTLTPNYPTGSHSSRPPSAAGTAPSENMGPFSPRLRAASVEPIPNIAPVEHSNLPKKLGSHSRYIQSLLEKTGRSSGSSVNLTLSPNVGFAGIPSTPQTANNSFGDRSSPSYPVQHNHQRKTSASESEERKESAPRNDPTITPTQATSGLMTTAVDGEIDNFATIKRSKPSVNSLKEVSARAAGSSTPTTHKESGTVKGNVGNREGNDSLVGEIDSIRNQMGVLERRFGSTNGAGVPAATKTASPKQPITAPVATVVAVEKENAGLTAALKAFETAVIYISRNIRQTLRNAIEMNKMIQASHPGANQQSTGSTLRALDSMMELMRPNEGGEKAADTGRE